MQATIQYIKKELAGFYPDSEISGFTRIILETVCDWGYSAQILNRNRKIEPGDFDRIQKIVSRLKEFEPLQYILGETEFYGLQIEVNKSVLIPRPETEELIDWMLKSNLPANCNILDIGTGSGCIALALKKNLPNANIYAMDVSSAALEVAQNNALKNKLEVHFILDDIINPANIKFNKFDVIVSNPPYVRDAEKLQMHKNVLKYEPGLALFVSDDDPLIFYRSISKFAAKHLNKNGKLFFEINEYLGSEMSDLLNKLGFSDIEIRKDINGKNRMLFCIRSI